MLKGSIPAIITPFSKGEVDFDCFANLLKWQIKEGISGVTVCGTTGESPTLTHDEHMKLVEFAVKVAGRKIPVIAGTGSNSTKEAIEFTKHAYKSGANYGLVVTPYYNKPNQLGLINHFKKIAKVSPLKQLIYNIPGRSILKLSTNLIKKLSNIKNIVGVKDATSDIPRVYETKTTIGEDFNQLTGDDATTLAFMIYGGHGSISVTSNIAPKLCSEFMKHCLDQNFAKASEINDKLMPLHHALFVESSPAPVKYAASKLGLCKDDIRLPLTSISDETKQLVDKAMKHASLI